MQRKNISRLILIRKVAQRLCLLDDLVLEHLRQGLIPDELEREVAAALGQLAQEGGEVLHLGHGDLGLDDLQAVVTPEETAYVRTAYREVKVSEEVKHYLMDIVEATRTQSGFVSGVSTRGALALYQAAQAYASLQGREYVIPEDIKGLAPAVLSHRISLGSSMNAEAAALRMRKLLAEITVPLESAE